MGLSIGYLGNLSAQFFSSIFASFLLLLWRFPLSLSLLSPTPGLAFLSQHCFRCLVFLLLFCWTFSVTICCTFFASILLQICCRYLLQIFCHYLLHIFASFMLPSLSFPPPTPAAALLSLTAVHHTYLGADSISLYLIIYHIWIALNR